MAWKPNGDQPTTAAPNRIERPMRESQIATALTGVLAACGLELESVEVIPAGRRRVVRVVVDGDGPAGRGPTLDEIAEATKAVSAALDASDAVGNQPYTLEVSSRGVGRPLTLPRHWRRNVGRLVSVTLADGHSMTGRIVASDEESAQLEVDGSKCRLELAELSKALVQVEFSRPSEDEEV